MNAIFLTQGGAIKPFYALMEALREPLALDKVGFLVSHYTNYQRFCQAIPDIESGKYSVLKEWEATSRARTDRPDLSLLRSYEEKLGVPHLWGPLVADRRVYLGEKCTFFQDYRPRFSQQEMLNILQAGLVAMERLFDEVRPDFVVSHLCVTTLEYLAYLFARAAGLPFLNLRATRVGNYVTYIDDIFEPSARIRATYERYRTQTIDDGRAQQAREYMDFVRSEHAMSEGNYLQNDRQPAKIPSVQRLVTGPIKLLRHEYVYRFGRVRDNHIPGVLVPLLYERILRPIRKWWQHRRLRHSYVTGQELSRMDYVLFPLHYEPEWVMLIHSKPYLNQIEVVRNISHNIPVGMTLLVKEHPNLLGRRPTGYYKALLEIPNVRLVDPALRSRPLIENAALIATIAGSIGWEAVLLKKPVIILGHTPYEFLPPSMIRRVADPERLGGEIADLTQNYDYQDDAVLSYLAAVMAESVSINFYSTLLGLPGRYTAGRADPESDEAWRMDVGRLAEYTISSLRRAGAVPAVVAAVPSGGSAVDPGPSPLSDGTPRED